MISVGQKIAFEKIIIVRNNNKNDYI